MGADDDDRPSRRADPPPRPTHFGLAVLALATGGFAIGTTEFVTMGVLPQIAEGVDVSIPSAGHVISAYALGVVIGAPVLAYFGARLPRRGLLIGLMAAYAVFNAASALAPSFEMLVVMRFLDGLPHGIYFGVASLVAASLAPPDRKGRAVATVMIGLSVANVVGVPAATWLGQQVGWRAVFLLVAALAVLTLLLTIAFVPSIPGRPRGTGPARAHGVRPAAGVAHARHRCDRLRRHVRPDDLHRQDRDRDRRAARVGGPALPAGVRARHGLRHLAGR